MPCHVTCVLEDIKGHLTESAWLHRRICKLIIGCVCVTEMGSSVLWWNTPFTGDHHKWIRTPARGVET